MVESRGFGGSASRVESIGSRNAKSDVADHAHAF